MNKQKYLECLLYVEQYHKHIIDEAVKAKKLTGTNILIWCSDMRSKGKMSTRLFNCIRAAHAYHDSPICYLEDQTGLKVLKYRNIGQKGRLEFEELKKETLQHA